MEGIQRILVHMRQIYICCLMLAEFSLTVKMNTINLLNQTTILVSNTSFFYAQIRRDGQAYEKE